MRLKLVVAISALVVGILAADASADHVKYETKVRIRDLTAGGATGTVVATKPACEDRRVYLYRESPKRDRIVGYTKAADEAGWTIEEDLQPGRYYAFVQIRRVSPGRHLCEADKSAPRRLSATGS